VYGIHCDLVIVVARTDPTAGHAGSACGRRQIAVVFSELKEAPRPM
jgi:hypothetical protein